MERQGVGFVPLGVEGDVSGDLGGEAELLLAGSVLIPAAEGIAAFCGGLRCGGLLAVIHGLRLGSGAVALDIEGNGVGLYRPGGGVAPVAGGTGRNGDSHGRLIQPGALPAGEVIAGPGGVHQGKSTRLFGVGGGVRLPGGELAAVQVVGDGVFHFQGAERGGGLVIRQESGGTVDGGGADLIAGIQGVLHGDGVAGTCLEGVFPGRGDRDMAHCYMTAAAGCTERSDLFAHLVAPEGEGHADGFLLYGFAALGALDGLLRGGCRGPQSLVVSGADALAGGDALADIVAVQVVAQGVAVGLAADTAHGLGGAGSGGAFLMIAQSANLAAALGALGLVLAIGAVVRGAGDILLQGLVAA